MTADDHIVFIVDDDVRIREALSELLASHGMRALAYGSAGEYVRADKPDLPACLILDVELPDINGLELVQFIRKSDRHRSTALIIISTQSSEKDRARGLSLGADDYLAKPLDPEALLSTVQRLLANRPAVG